MACCSSCIIACCVSGLCVAEMCHVYICTTTQLLIFNSVCNAYSQIIKREIEQAGTARDSRMHPNRSDLELCRPNPVKSTVFTWFWKVASGTLRDGSGTSPGQVRDAYFWHFAKNDKTACFWQFFLAHVQNPLIRVKLHVIAWNRT